MESDRLLHPVFREFYSERDVVREERRLRSESTPTGLRGAVRGPLLEVIALLLARDRLADATSSRSPARRPALFDVYYAPNNLTACLVGDFDPDRALELARKYFGRLPRGPPAPEPVRTREAEQAAEKRMVAHADTRPQVASATSPSPDGHPDDYALTLLGEHPERPHRSAVQDARRDKEPASRTARPRTSRA